MGKSMLDIIEASMNRLTKEQISEFLNMPAISKLKKADLINNLKSLLLTSEIEHYRLYEKYKEVFGIHPSVVEELLKCTKTERQRWTKEEKLKIVKNKSFHAYGKDLECPFYDAFQIHNITDAIMNKWRLEQEKIKQENAKNAIKQRKTTLRLNEEIREDFKSKFKKVLTTWYKVSMKLGVTFELAFWTVWISRWAKEYGTKSISAKSTKKKNEYKIREQEFYSLKNRAIELLLKTEFKMVGLYRPENPDKISLHFCDNHYSDWRFLREDIYMSKWDYFDMKKREILKCPECNVDIEKDYYSLYYLSIQDDRVDDFKFSFHSPYPISKHLFSKIENVEEIKHVENDGIFRFGRPLFEEEKIIYTENLVIKKFQEAMDKFSLYYE